MRWIAAAASLLPLPALACLEKPGSSCGGLDLTFIIVVVVASCAIGWVVRRVLDASGKHTPEAASAIAAVAGLIGGQLLWYFLQRF